MTPSHREKKKKEKSHGGSPPNIHSSDRGLAVAPIAGSHREEGGKKKRKKRENCGLLTPAPVEGLDHRRVPLACVLGGKKRGEGEDRAFGTDCAYQDGKRTASVGGKKKKKGGGRAFFHVVTRPLLMMGGGKKRFDQPRRHSQPHWQGPVWGAMIHLVPPQEEPLVRELMA